jgi:hypothetical protein
VPYRVGRCPRLLTLLKPLRRRIRTAAIGKRRRRHFVAAALRAKNGSSLRLRPLRHVSFNGLYGTEPNLELIQQRELSAAQRAVAAMHDAVALKREIGLPVLPETRTAIVELEKQISALRTELVPQARKGLSDGYLSERPPAAWVTSLGNPRSL